MYHARRRVSFHVINRVKMGLKSHLSTILIHLYTNRKTLIVDKKKACYYCIHILKKYVKNIHSQKMQIEGTWKK